MARVTPEGKVKTAVKRLLNCYANLYQHWPVLNGMGKPTLDCIGIYYGQGFAIETKAPDKKPTPRQWDTIKDIQTAGGMVFVIDDVDHLGELESWLNTLSALNSVE
jgi:hypothetical protein